MRSTSMTWAALSRAGSSTSYTTSIFLSSPLPFYLQFVIVIVNIIVIHVKHRLIIQLPDSSPAPKIEIINDPENPVSESDGPSNFVQTSNPKGEKEKMQETGKKEDVKEKEEKSKEKKSLMKKLLGCFSCCIRPQKKQKEEMVT